MFGHLVVAALLCAQGDVKLAAPGLSKLGISAEQARFYGNHLVARLSAQPWLKVISADDIAQVLGMERQRELLGCTDAKNSCVAELAGALGADGLVTGQVARVGKSFQLNVKVIDPAANTLFVYSSERLAKEEDLLDELNKVAELIAGKLEPLRKKREAPVELQAAPVAVEPAAPPPVTEHRAEPASQPTFWPALGVAAAGVVVLAGAAVCWVNVNQQWGSLPRAASFDDARHIRDAGKQWQLAAGIASGVGGALLVGGLLWYFLHPASPAEVALFADGQGAFATLRWGW